MALRFDFKPLIASFLVDKDALEMLPDSLLIPWVGQA